METLPTSSPNSASDGDSPTPEPEGRMTFTQHLGELRTRLVRSAATVLVAMIVCYVFSNQLIVLIAKPLASFNNVETIEVPTDLEGTDGDDSEGADGDESEGEETLEEAVVADEEPPIEWTVLNPLEPVLVKLKVAGYGGLFVSLPMILYQICGFIFPGLTAKEKRVVKVLIVGCSVLATGGVAVAYWAVFPLVLPYLTTFAPDFVNVQLRMNETLSLLLKGFAGFAIAFQFPLVVLVLVGMGLLTPATLREYRKYAVVIMCFAGMALTPPDPFSMLMMAAPLILLYEISIWASYLVVWRKKKSDEAEPAK